MGSHVYCVTRNCNSGSILLNKNISSAFLRISQHAPVFFHFIRLAITNRSSFSILRVWSWPPVSLHFTRLAMTNSLSFFYVCTRPSFSTSMSDHARPPVFFHLDVCTRLSFSTAHIWPWKPACLFPFRVSEHEGSFVFFHFICLIMSGHLSFFTSRVWPWARVHFFPNYFL